MEFTGTLKFRNMNRDGLTFECERYPRQFPVERETKPSEFTLYTFPSAVAAQNYADAENLEYEGIKN